MANAIKLRNFNFINSDNILSRNLNKSKNKVKIIKILQLSIKNKHYFLQNSLKAKEILF